VSQDIDVLTLKQHLNHAMTRFLGLTGSAIAIDILHVTKSFEWEQGNQYDDISMTSITRLGKAIIRVHRDDANAVMAAAGAYTNSEHGVDIGFSVLGKGAWLGALIGTLHEDNLWK
jgi:RNase P/RNase MRP subunit POP5